MERKIQYKFRSDNTGAYFKIPSKDINKQLAINSIIVSEGYHYIVRNILVIDEGVMMFITFIVSQSKIIDK